MGKLQAMYFKSVTLHLKSLTIDLDFMYAPCPLSLSLNFYQKHCSILIFSKIQLVASLSLIEVSLIKNIECIKLCRLCVCYYPLLHNFLLVFYFLLQFFGISRTSLDFKRKQIAVSIFPKRYLLN